VHVSAPSPLAAAQGDARRRRDAGDVAGAAAALTAALEWARAAYGEDHPEVLAAAHQLARLHMEAGEAPRARRVLEEALAAGQRRLGDGDPLLLAISFDLGAVAEELGNRHEARRNFGRVASAGPAVLGDDHWAVRAARTYLGGQVPPTAATAAAPPPAHQQTHAHQQAPPHTAPPHTAPPHTAPPHTAPPHGYARAVPPQAPPARRGRGTAVVAGVAAAAAVTAVVLAAVAVHNNGNNNGNGNAGAPTTPPVSVTGDPPTDVRVARDGEALVLTWTDPAPGRVSFVITGGKEGEELRFVGQLPSGARPRFPVHGFNPALAYCFQVAAVYSTTELGVAQPVCTVAATGPTPR
jgi:hypothetical protein